MAIAACGGTDSASQAASPGASTATAAALTATPGTGATSTVAAGLTLAPGEYPQLGVYTDTVYTAGDPSFTALDGATAEFGTLADATYRIEMPDNWNGDLVVWAHGFKGFGTELDVDTPPQALRRQLIDLGYAWAASSYSENGYAPGIGADDSLAVRDYFIGEYGEPSAIYLVGASMGGNVVALSLEDFPGAYDGALSICGAIGGETEIDYLVSWAHLAAYFAGTRLPLEAGALAVTLTLTGDVSKALGEPAAPTLAGQQFASTIKLLTGGPRPFFDEGFLEQYVANFAYILSDPGLETATARAATNNDTVYSIEPGLGVTVDEINAGVFRQVADPDYRNTTSYPDKVPTSGKLTAPLLTLHGTGDLFVPISQEQQYLASAKAAGTENLLVQRAIRSIGHCEFSDAEISQAFTDLVAWVKDGTRPAGDDLSGDLSDIGLAFTNPLREGDPALD